jgi:Xaa-Pro dipeptidase
MVGAEAMAFESLVAGPTRSWGIHAFPAYGGGPFGGTGMSIFDFGVVVDGYPSDVTLTVARGKLSTRREEMIELVERAYELAALRARPGAECFEVAQAVNELFGSKGYSMPHSLGHGIGLQVHEAPYLRARRESSVALVPGMVFTIEPGLYDEEAGGVRWENDFLVTSSGCEVLTTSRILRFP